MGTENTAYLSDEFVFEKCLSESTTSASNGILRVVKGPIAEWDKLNRNRRKYSEKLWDNVLASPYVIEQLRYKTLYGEANHPTDRYEVDFSRVSHSITEMWKVPATNQIYATINILDTPLGRILNTLYEAGGVLGYSSRAGGTLTKRKDYTDVDEKTYNFITFDAVPYPSVEVARLDTISEGVNSNKVELSEECHNKLLGIIKESGTKDRELIKDLIYSLQSYNFAKEVEVFESFTNTSEVVGVESGNSKLEETTKFLLKESSVQIDNLKAEKSALSTTVTKLQGENASLKVSLDTSLQKVSDLVAESNSAKNLSKNLEGEYANTFSRLNEKIESLTSDVLEKDEELLRYENLQEAFTAVKLDNECLKKEKNSLLNEGTKLSNQDLLDTSKELSTAINEINLLNESLETLKADKLGLATELEQSTHKIMELEATIAEMSKGINEGYQKSSLELEDLTKEYKTLETSNTKLSADNANLASELESLQESVGVTKSLYRTAKADLISVIASSYGLSAEEVSLKIPVGNVSKSDIYCICEQLHNESSARSVEFEPVIEGSSVVSESVKATDTLKEEKKCFIDLGPNRRGLGVKL